MSISAFPLAPRGTPSHSSLHPFRPFACKWTLSSCYLGNSHTSGAPKYATGQWTGRFSRRRAPPLAALRTARKPRERAEREVSAASGGAQVRPPQPIGVAEDRGEARRGGVMAAAAAESGGRRVGFVGAGRMAEAIAHGLIQAGRAPRA